MDKKFNLDEPIEFKDLVDIGLEGYEKLEEEGDPVLQAFEKIYISIPEICTTCGRSEECIWKSEDNKMDCPIVLTMIGSLQKNINRGRDLTPWVGFELDGTLSETLPVDDNYDREIGDPIPLVIDFVKALLDKGTRVKIFTSRVSELNPKKIVSERSIRKWSKKHIGVTLETTSEKDPLCVALFASSIRQVVMDHGLLVDQLLTQSYGDLKELRQKVAEQVAEKVAPPWTPKQ